MTAKFNLVSLAMAPSLDSLQKQRDQVLEQMSSLDRLRRGTLSRQFLKRKRGGQTLTHGPSFVLQGYLHGQKLSRHVPATQAQEVGEQVDNYKRFQGLAEEFVDVTDRITQMD